MTGVGGVFPKARDPKAPAECCRAHLGLETQAWGGATLRRRELERVLAELRAEGCQVDTRTEVSECGKFGWVVDPEGNTLELWGPAPGACRVECVEALSESIRGPRRPARFRARG